MNIAIIGLGYVGVVTAGCLSSLGRSVIGVDTDPHKTDAVAAGRSPVSEPGVDELLGTGIEQGRIRIASIRDAVADSDVIMVCVGTPSAASGALDLSAVVRVCEEIGSSLPDDGRFRTIVIRSTVLPGTTSGLVRETLERASGRRAGDAFGLGTNPEFLREGTGVRDFYEASRTIIGADDERSAVAIQAVYEGINAPVHVVSIATSEMAKYTDNSFHALKISFANEISAFSRAFGVDGRSVMELMMADDRLNISTAYLRPGFAFGGSCLPKDLRAITDKARKSDVNLPLLDAVLQSNTATFERGVSLVEQAGGRRVCILGLSFKTATDDLRESPAVNLAERLLGRGYSLSIYDPDIEPARLLGANKAFIERHVPHLGALLCDTLAAALTDRDTVVVTKFWPELAQLPELVDPAQNIVDLVGLTWPAGERPGAYLGIGW